MKNNLLILLAIFAIGFASCEPEEEGGPDAPSTDARNKLVGMWDVVENNQIETKSALENYQVEIINDTLTTDKIIIANFYNLGMTKDAVVGMSSLDLSINSQNIDGFTVNGTGTISSNYKTISLDYIVDDGSGEKDTVTATYSKQ